MAALTANTVITIRSPEAHRVKVSRAVAASVHIYAGAKVGSNPAGHLKPYVFPDLFVGIADEEFYASSSTQGAPSALGDDGEQGKTKCRIIISGHIEEYLSGVAITDIGKPVFAQDDGSIGLIGHPDAYMGKIINIAETADYCIVELKEPGDQCPMIDGLILARLTGQDTIPNVITASNETAVGAFRFDSIGAGITAGAGWKNVVNVAGGEIVGTLDNDSEAQNLTIETQALMSLTYGMSIRFKGRLSVLGPTATTDFTVGLMTAATSTITDAIRADTEVTTAGIGKAALHVDGDSTNILVKTDDDATVTSVDTTIDNSLTVNKDLLVMIRPSGAVELWNGGTRLLASTTLSIGSSLTTMWAGVVNLEKSTGTDVSAVNIQLLEVKGASLAA